MGRTYKNPYDDAKFQSRDEAELHVVRNYSDKIPEGHTAKQVIYDELHKGNRKKGICSVPDCNNKTAWNETGGKYYRVCDSKACSERVRDNYLKNIKKVYDTDNLAADPEYVRDKLMANRRIAQTYEWSDGSDSKRVLSKLEVAVLRVLDEDLEYSSDDVVSPGEVIKYRDQNGKKAYHVPDVYIKSLDLIISVKDGLDNPNMSPHFKKDRLKNLLIYQNILNHTRHNYVQIEGEADLPKIKETLKSVKKFHRRGGRYVMPPRIDFFLYEETDDAIGKNATTIFRNFVLFKDPRNNKVVHGAFVHDIIRDTFVMTYTDGVIVEKDAKVLYENYNVDFIKLKEPITVNDFTYTPSAVESLVERDTIGMLRYWLNDVYLDFTSFYDELCTDKFANLEHSWFSTTRDNICREYNQMIDAVLLDEKEDKVAKALNAIDNVGEFLEERFGLVTGLDGKSTFQMGGDE